MRACAGGVREQAGEGGRGRAGDEVDAAAGQLRAHALLALALQLHGAAPELQRAALQRALQLAGQALALRLQEVAASEARGQVQPVGAGCSCGPAALPAFTARSTVTGANATAGEVAASDVHEVTWPSQVEVAGQLLNTRCTWSGARRELHRKVPTRTSSHLLLQHLLGQRPLRLCLLPLQRPQLRLLRRHPLPQLLRLV